MAPPLGAVAGNLVTKRMLARAPKGGAILVSSRPSGAIVELDGKPVSESTPTALAGLGPGKHTLRVHGQGYGNVEQVVTLGTGERSAIDVVLPPETRTLDIQTIPAGALLYLDGQLAPGHTPLTVSITEDDFHELRLERPGYEPAVRALKPEEHQRQLSIYLQAEKQDRGTVWIDANRTAQVFLDGGDSGFTTPTGGLQLPVGKHLVELRDQQGNLGASAKVNVVKGDVVHLALEFAAGRTEKSGARAEKGGRVQKGGKRR
jgi:hypothetical protein